MDRNLEGIAIAAARECVRQGVGEDALIRLLTAHDAAMTFSYRLPTLREVMYLGELIEPPLIASGALIRQTPVVFTGGGSAVDHDLIQDTLVRMFEQLDAGTDPHEFTKAFLDVHPFRDGNGRTAWLLFNWLAGSLGDPLPLPDFYHR